MKALKGKMIIKMDVSQKEKYTLTEGVTIQIIKGFNFNLRQDRASYGYAVDGGDVPKGAAILCHHLAIEPSYVIENETILSQDEKKEGFKVFSIPLDMCFAYNEGNGWVPCKDFLITERIFLPYKGKLVGIDHQLVKNRMFVVKGFDEFGEIDLSGKCVITLENCDYEIIFHTEEHKEGRLIRTRGREVIGIDEGLAKEINKGKYLLGISPTNCKQIKNGNVKKTTIKH